MELMKVKAAGDEQLRSRVVKLRIVSVPRMMRAAGSWIQNAEISQTEQHKRLSTNNESTRVRLNGCLFYFRKSPGLLFRTLSLMA